MDANQLAKWLVERLSSERARAEWRGLVEASFEAWLDRPLSEVLPPGEVEAVLAAFLTTPRLEELARAQVRGALVGTLVEARQDDEPIGRWVSDAARADLDALLAKKGLVDPVWIREIFAQKATEELVSDTLYRALRDFSQLIPRLLQSALPSSLGRLARLGGRALEEVEKRLEGEIRRFLDAGTRRALDGAAKFAADHIDDPISVESRKNMVAFALGRSGKFHSRALTDDLVKDIEALAVELARGITARDETKETLHRVVARIRAEHGDGTVREWLRHHGVTEAPPFDAWADLTWPSVHQVVTSAPVAAWLAGISEELLAELGPGPA